VKVAESERSIKYASAHDLRRAFGFRWSRLVMPAVLKELMRHETFQTTMEDYVGQNAEATADVVWSAIAKHSAKRTEFEVPDSAETKPQPADG
jgi:integrase